MMGKKKMITLSMKHTTICLLGVEVVGAGGWGFAPVLPSAAVPPGVSWWEIQAVPKHRLSGKSGAEEIFGFLADRFS
jgi:hypothetical protein